jgi:hypothetical protein
MTTLTFGSTFTLFRANDLDELWNEGAFILLVSLKFVSNLIEATKDLDLSEEFNDFILSL